MPYIKQEHKDKMEIATHDSKLTDYFATLSLGDFAGHLNYLNFKIVRHYIKVNGKRYFTFATIVGTLVCCILEIYRRLVAGYEDKKIEENGDVG